MHPFINFDSDLVVVDDDDDYFQLLNEINELSALQNKQTMPLQCSNVHGQGMHLCSV